MKLLSSMKLSIKCNVMKLPIQRQKYDQEKGKNYPEWKGDKDIQVYKPNPFDYDSDKTNESRKKETSNVQGKIKK